MSKCQNLPSEILDNIFRMGCKCKELYHFSLTCRSWRSAAQRVLFENLPDLKDDKISALVNALSIYQDHSSCIHFSHISPGNFVKTVDCSLFGTSFDKDILNTLFPFIQVIKIATDAPNRDENFAQLYKLIMKGKFPNLEDVPTFIAGEKYLKFLSTRREYIQQLDLARLDSNVLDKIMKNLNTFPRLTKIKMCYGRDETNVWLEKMAPRHIPQLRKIDVEFMTCAEHALNTSLDDKKTVQILPNVRQVEILNQNLLCGGDDFFLYLMKKFPNLDHLKIVCNSLKDVFHVDNYTTLSLPCTTQFFTYLFNLKTCSVNPIITDEFTDDIVGDVLKQALVQKIPPFLNVVVNLTIHFEIVHWIQTVKYSQKRTGYISVSSIRCNTKKVVNIDVRYKVLPDTIFQSHLEHLQNVGHMGLRGLIIGSEEMLASIEEQVALDSIFDQFKMLEKLQIFGMRNITCKESHNLEKEKPKKALKSLTIGKCYFTKDLFPAISKRFHNLKSLEIIDCVYIVNNANHQSNNMERICPIIMKSTRIEEIHLIIHFEKLLYDDYETAFIKLETANKKPRFCKIGVEYNTIVYAREIKYVRKSTNNEYLTCLKEKKCIVYDIQCESATKLTVSTNPDKRYRALFEEETYWDEYLEEVDENFGTMTFLE